MNALYIAIAVVAGLFFVASGVLLPLFDLLDQLPGRRKVHPSKSVDNGRAAVPAGRASGTTAQVKHATYTGSASAPVKATGRRGEKIAA